MSEHTPTPISKIDMGYIGRVDGATGDELEPTDEALIFLKDDNEQTCHVEGPDAKAMAQQIVKAVNRDHHFEALAKALESLTNEVSGVWEAFEYGIRQEISNTNYAIVREKLAEADQALAMAGRS